MSVDKFQIEDLKIGTGETLIFEVELISIG